MAYRDTKGEALRVASGIRLRYEAIDHVVPDIRVEQSGERWAIIEVATCSVCGESFTTHAIGEDWICAECDKARRRKWQERSQENAARAREWLGWADFHDNTLN